MKQWVWMSFDLGIDGDYESLYYWLDSKDARECGDNIAAFYYDRPGEDDIAAIVKSELESSVKLRNRDRIYLIFKNSEGHHKGKFIHGKRRPASWEGYADKSGDDDVDG